MNNLNGSSTVARAQRAADTKDATDALQAAFDTWQADPTEEHSRVVYELTEVLASVAGLDHAEGLQPVDWESDAASLITDVRRRLESPAHALPVAVRMTEIAEPQDRAWLVDQWLPRGRIGMLTAEGGFGKSRLALQLAAAMTTDGGEWLPRGVNKSMPETAAGVVVFATWEDEPEECRRRIGRERAAAMQDCHIVDMARFGPLWGAETGQVTQTRGKLLKVGRWLRDLCEQLGADLLIVDSLAGAFGANEIDRAAVREFMANWDGWGRAADCAVMLISHPSQSGAKQTGGYSGSTDWHGASRWRWSMQTEGEGQDKRQYLLRSKANYAQDGARVSGPSFQFKRQLCGAGRLRGGRCCVQGHLVAL